MGKGFEQKTVFLPQLLLSAEAAKAAFEQVKEHITVSGEEKYPVILATVKGDIHDIGKNIVKVLLESYGFPVIDLGRDVAPERIVQEAKQRNVPLVGLSALMTTTVGAMEETIKLLRRDAPQLQGGCRRGSFDRGFCPANWRRQVCGRRHGNSAICGGAVDELNADEI